MKLIDNPKEDLPIIFAAVFGIGGFFFLMTFFQMWGRAIEYTNLVYLFQFLISFTPLLAALYVFGYVLGGNKHRAGLKTLMWWVGGLISAYLLGLLNSTIRGNSF